MRTELEVLQELVDIVPGAPLRRTDRARFLQTLGLGAYGSGINADGASPAAEKKARILRAISNAAYEMPLPPRWAEQVDVRGYVYFSNALRTEATWAHPLQPAFVETLRFAGGIADRDCTLGEAAAAVREHLRWPFWLKRLTAKPFLLIGDIFFANMIGMAFGVLQCMMGFLVVMRPAVGTRKSATQEEILSACDATCRDTLSLAGPDVACAMPECSSCLGCGIKSGPVETSPCDITCSATLSATGPEVACAMPECSSCAACTSSGPVEAAYTPSQGGCNGLYREMQVGLKCGRHAVNAILVNLGLSATSEQELDEMAANVGSPSNGQDYDLAALTFTLMEVLGYDSVIPVGELHAPPKPIAELIQGVGRVEAHEGASAAERAALQAKEFTVHVKDLQWVLCNVDGHWKTYFHKWAQEGDWCNLDSIPARQGKEAAKVPNPSMVGLKCRAIIVPTPAKQGR